MQSNNTYIDTFNVINKSYNITVCGSPMFKGNIQDNNVCFGSEIVSVDM